MPIPAPNLTLRDLFPAAVHHVNYLVNWSEKNRLIYVETPKVGCTSIKKILQYNELDCDESRLPSDVHEREQSPLKSPNADEAGFVRRLASSEYFTFTFVRDPITRVLSAYLDKIVAQPGEVTPAQREMGIDPAERIPTFAEFIEMVHRQRPFDMNVHWAPQAFLLGIDKVQYDYIGRFECFNQSIEHLVARRGLKLPPSAMRHGRAHATNASDLLGRHYTNAALERVREIYHDDFRYLGYGWSL